MDLRSCSLHSMSLVETIRLWQEGVCAADRKEWGAALEAFTAVQNPPAKICFNIGCVHLVLGSLAQAEEVRYSPWGHHSCFQSYQTDGCSEEGGN